MEISLNYFLNTDLTTNEDANKFDSLYFYEDVKLLMVNHVSNLGLFSPIIGKNFFPLRHVLFHFTSASIQAYIHVYIWKITIIYIKHYTFIKSMTNISYLSLFLLPVILID